MPKLLLVSTERIQQIFKWLKYTWIPPGGHKARLRLVKKMPEKYEGCSGICVWNEKDDATLWVKHTTASETIDVLLHEYAHILTEGRGKCDGHGNEFYLMYGSLERHFHYYGGSTDSRTF